jgi:hypothetical protein
MASGFVVCPVFHTRAKPGRRITVMPQAVDLDAREATAALRDGSAERLQLGFSRLVEAAARDRVGDQRDVAISLTPFVDCSRRLGLDPAAVLGPGPSNPMSNLRGNRSFWGGGRQGRLTAGLRRARMLTWIRQRVPGTPPAFIAVTVTDAEPFGARDRTRQVRWPRRGHSTPLGTAGGSESSGVREPKKRSARWAEGFLF